jgi:hypothetical protein
LPYQLQDVLQPAANGKHAAIVHGMKTEKKEK